MILKLVRDDAKEEKFFRHVSENNIIEMFIYPVMFGYRVRIGYVENVGALEYDYCAGAEQKNVQLLFSILKTILENMTETEFESCEFPWQERKPVFNDIKCFTSLLEMAGELKIVEIPTVFEFRKKVFEKLNFPI